MEPRETEGRKEAKNNLVRVPSGSCLPRYRSSSSSSSITPMPAAFQAGDRASFFFAITRERLLLLQVQFGTLLFAAARTDLLYTDFFLSLSLQTGASSSQLDSEACPPNLSARPVVDCFWKGPYSLSLSGFHSFFLSALEDRERKRQRNNFMQL